MNFYREDDIMNFFDVSVVLVANSVLHNLVLSLSNNIRFIRRNGIEVVLSVPKGCSTSEVFSLLDNFPDLNWKVFVEGRTINETMQHVCEIACNKYLLFIESFAKMETDVVYQLRYMVEHYPRTFVISPEVANDVANAKYLMVERSACFFLKDMSSVLTWDQVWCRLPELLTVSGWQGLRVPQAILYTLSESSDSEAQIKSSLSHCTCKEPLGKSNEAGKSLFNWETEKIKKARELVLSKFSDVSIADTQVFDKEYGVIALVQIRNEKYYLEDLLSHLNAYCNGVILLDDGSDDGAYELASAVNLLVKARKLYNGYFNDLQNRNLLLELANLFRCNWFFFIDADERFYGGADEILSYAKRKDIDVVAFRLVHLWDSPDKFRVDIPENETGILYRFRMFRNRGFMQIVANKELHFPATPFRQNVHRSSLLIKHYGLMDAKVREMKHERYERQDGSGIKQGYSYEYLVDGAAVLRNIDEILETVNDDCSLSSKETNV